MTTPRSIASAAAVACAACLCCAVATADEPSKTEQVIKWRQSAYELLGWNARRIKNSLESGYSKDEVIQAASIIDAIANGGLDRLFAPGTERGVGWRETKAKPAVWTDPNGVAQRSAAFVREADELLRVARTGDQPAVKEQFGRLGKSCKACHEDFRVKDD